MARLPQIKRLSREDFPGLEWTGKLFPPINQFFQSVYEALDRNLTLIENSAAQAHEFDVIENNITYPLSFLWQRKRFPTDVFVTRVLSDDGSLPLASVGVVWSFDGTNVLVSKIFGLDGTKRYKIRVLAIGN